MPPNTQRRAAAKVRLTTELYVRFVLRQWSSALQFYQEDIVHRADNPQVFGVVLVSVLSPMSMIQLFKRRILLQRCWQDAEDLPPLADNVDPLMRPLVQVRSVDLCSTGCLHSSVVSLIMT